MLCSNNKTVYCPLELLTGTCNTCSDRRSPATELAAEEGPLLIQAYLRSAAALMHIFSLLLLSAPIVTCVYLFLSLHAVFKVQQRKKRTKMVNCMKDTICSEYDCWTVLSFPFVSRFIFYQRMSSTGLQYIINVKIYFLDTLKFPITFSFKKIKTKWLK